MARIKRIDYIQEVTPDKLKLIKEVLRIPSDAISVMLMATSFLGGRCILLDETEKLELSYQLRSEVDEIQKPI